MPKERILVVDDEQPIRRFLKVTLASQSYAVVEASSGQEALSTAAAEKPDIIILDLGLPDIDGIEVTKLLRKWTQVPIIVLSVRDSENDKITALDAGADDYLTKPFGVGELLARIRANLRHTAPSQSEPVFTSGNLTVDLTKRLVTLNGNEVQLTPTEYELLSLLVKNAGKVITHNHLLQKIWGPEYSGELHMLHVNISNLRRKIEPEPARPHFIITEPGVGYRLKAE